MEVITIFYIEKDTELTAELLQKVMDKFSTYVQPQLKKRKDYYDGKHAILQKKYSDENKPCSRIVTNFAKIIVDTYAGYICGKSISYTSNDDISDIQEIINYNDDAAENIAFCTNALTYGVAYELQWLDKDTKTRYSQTSPINSFPIYDNTLDRNLLYFVRWYDANSIDDNDDYIVEVYSPKTIKTYRVRGIGGALEFVEETNHFFNDVPVSVFWLNEDTRENIFDCIVTLNDAYNELQSSQVDDFSAFCDAYLALTDMEQTTEEDIASMKENRVLLLPAGGTAQWITKNSSDTTIVNMLENIKQNIFKITACPDMADDTFLAQSGTALAYKLVGLENKASAIVAKFTKAIQRRIELICKIENLKASDAVWRDIQINFVRNLPVNITETIQLVTALKGTVSDATLLSQIPFITDVEAELEAIQKQKEENMAMYDFGGSFFSSDDEDEEEEV